MYKEAEISLVTLSTYDIAGIFLGNRKQHDLAMCMDIQILSSSSSQLHDCICDHCIGDSSTLPMDILSSRKRIE